MKNGNKNYEILCDFETNPFQYEPICSADGRVFEQYVSSCSNSEIEQYTSNLDFNGLYDFDLSEQEGKDICCDAAYFFDLEK